MFEMFEVSALRNDVYNDFYTEPLAHKSILKKKKFGTYNPTTGRNEITETEYPCVILFKKISPSKSVPRYYEIREGDKMCMIASKGIEINVKDQIVIDSNVYEIKYCQDISVGALALFEAIIR